MNKEILIVEDGIVEANNLRIIMENAGYVVSGLVDSYERALAAVENDRPDLVFPVVLRHRRWTSGIVTEESLPTLKWHPWKGITMDHLKRPLYAHQLNVGRHPGKQYFHILPFCRPAPFVAVGSFHNWPSRIHCRQSSGSYLLHSLFLPSVKKPKCHCKDW